MKAKFTNGEWLMAREPKSTGLCGTPQGHFKIETNEIYHFITIQNETREESKANAHLIAVAPDMYAMLSELSGSFGQQDDSYCVAKSIEIDALLSKARGE